MLTFLSKLSQLLVEPFFNFKSGVGMGRFNLSFGLEGEIDLCGCISGVAFGLFVEGFRQGHFLVFLVYFVFVENGGSTSNNVSFAHLKVDYLQFGDIVLYLDASAEVIQFLVEEL